MTPADSMTSTAAGSERPSTNSRYPSVGETVLVTVDANAVRPMIVSSLTRVQIGLAKDAPMELRVSGTIFADPGDHNTPAFRGWSMSTADPARIHGRPDRLLTVGYGEHLAYGLGIGQWSFRP